MSIILLLLVLGPAMTLLLSGILSSRVSKWRIQTIRRTITWVTGLQCGSAVAALLSSLPSLLRGDSPVVFELVPPIASLYVDGFSLLMLNLVSFVGFVVCRFSVRYLDGDPNQGSFFRWLAFTISGVSLFVVSGNLLMLFAAWMLASFGLHHLLVHYSNRPAASRAAWTKFGVSRIGDLLLISAIALIYREFGTFELAKVFAAQQVDAQSGSWSLTAIAWLIMFAAVAKSAQFPFHAWLPNTLEAPTPVSALMHAGIVNAGGYLVIRLSPLLAEVPAALGVLAIIGSVTVGYAGIVMMTQPSIKRALAYSTIAQMGFMMLQCGIGAFSVAMLHILAHSVYKAYAFLNSGSVLTEAEGQRVPQAEGSQPMRGADYAGGFVLAATSVLLSSLLFQIDLLEKSGGLAIGFVLTLAITAWLWDVFRLDSIRATAVGLATAAALAMLYMTGYFVVSQLVAGNVPQIQAGLIQTVATADVFIVFSALFGLKWLLATKRGREILAPLYVHAANGFYIEAFTRRALPFGRS